MRTIVHFGGVILSAALIWFTVSNYLSAGQIAEENLRGLALSLTSAIENVAFHDPSLQSLGTFQSHDIAFFTLTDRKSLCRFHTNPDLIGSHIQETAPLATLKDGVISSERVILRTGENAFEFNAPVHLPGETLALRLILHTYRADAVVRRARLNMMVLFALLAAGWILALALHRFTRREEQHKLEMARRESLAQLGEMGAILAHEIRNPLAGIKGYAQVIAKKPEDERNGGFARRIVLETLRLETLVSDLLSYARSERNSTAAVDIGEVAVHTADLLRHEAEQLHVEIVSECPEGILIPGNRDRLSQALLNIGKNAVQAVSDGGTVRITVETAGRQAIIRVCDDGQGINLEDMSRIFEPFFTTKARGSGLGLALCRKIIEEHGGKIAVQSVAGEGTSVTIAIPISQNY
ncbi:MAG: ATP-binding protein [Desulfuromonadaceae bacterium]|nr:ATP-binding protein [Desulfuromonadaceae bacterium]